MYPVSRVPQTFQASKGGDRAVTEQLVQGIMGQAVALLQLRRLGATQKVATAGFLQVCTGLGSNFFSF